jgi:hypothetical protein
VLNQRRAQNKPPLLQVRLTSFDEMARYYFSTTVELTKEIWDDGFWDMHTEFGRVGVLFTDTPLDAQDGHTVTLCVELPEDVFAKYEFDDPEHRFREALIPAHTLNKLQKPQVYDHSYVGLSRREMKQAAERWERGGLDDFRHAEEVQAAMKFFDEIGWLTPLRLREQANSR